MFNYIWQKNVTAPTKPFYMVYTSSVEGNTKVGWSYDKDSAFTKALAFGMNNVKAIVTYHLDMSQEASKKWIVENQELVEF